MIDITVKCVAVEKILQVAKPVNIRVSVLNTIPTQ